MLKIVNRRGLIILTIALCFAVAMLALVPLVNCPPEYDPWYDINDDGKIDLKDYFGVGKRYGATGTPIEKASIENDSGWINITDKCGQYFNITHNLNSTDLIVDIQGRTTPDSGPHQKHYGLTTHIPGWSRTYGGASDDVAYSVAQTSDGGYIIAGCTSSGGEGGLDFWLVKTDWAGDLEWSRTYGGSDYDEGHCVRQTTDGGYIVAGYTQSFGPGNGDIWLVKTDGNGKMQWNKTYGSTDMLETTWEAIQTSDGGYAVLGTQHVGYGDWDTLLFKIYANGTQQWNMTYGGSAEDFGQSLIQCPDGGYAIGGHTYSFGDAFGDAWLVKTYANGSVQWSKTYGDLNSEVATCVIRTSDGGYALGGCKGPYMGVVDFWLVKTDWAGNALWNRTYGGTGDDVAYALVQTADGGYALGGQTNSFGAGGYDFWLVRTDASGNMQWNKTYGGTGDERAYALIQTAGGGYALAGQTTSFGAGNKDLWLVKTDVESGLAWIDSSANAVTLYRGATDPYWNFVRVRIWKPKTP